MTGAVYCVRNPNVRIFIIAHTKCTLHTEINRFVSLFPVIGIQYPVFIAIDTDADSRAGRDTGERDFPLMCPRQSDELGESQGRVPNAVGAEKSGGLVYEPAARAAPPRPGCRPLS